MNNINTKKRILTGKAFACAVLLIVLLAVLTSCTPKEPVTADFFEEKAQALGYTTEDVTDQYMQEDFKVIKGIAVESDCLYITFFETDSSDSAALAFAVEKANFEENKEDSSEETSVSMGTYQKYTLVAQGNYFLAERVGKTFVSADCHGADTQKVTELLDAIGY